MATVTSSTDPYRYTELQLQQICKNLNAFDPKKDQIIAKLLENNRILPVAVQAPEGFINSIIRKFYKPPTERYAYISDLLLKIFEENLGFFTTTGINTVTKFTHFLSKNEANKQRVQAIQTQTKTNLPRLIQMRQDANQQGNCLITCEDGKTTRADAIVLIGHTWFKTALEHAKKENELFKIDLSNYPVKLVNALLDLIYLDKFRETLTPEEHWQFYFLLEFVQDPKKEFYIQVMQETLGNMKSEALMELLEMNYPPDLEKILVTVLLQRIADGAIDLMEKETFVNIIAKLERMQKLPQHWLDLYYLYVRSLHTDTIFELLLREKQPADLEEMHVGAFLSRIRWYTFNEIHDEFLKQLIEKIKTMKEKPPYWQILYAHLLLKGWGIAQNVGEAVKILQTLNNFPRAQSLLGYCHDYGIGVEKDRAIAATYYKSAAEQGNAAAHYNLALYFQEENNILLASQHCIEAARRRFAPAMAPAIKMLNITGAEKERLLKEIEGQGWTQPKKQ